MQVTADMIISRGGTSLPLDQRRKDALAVWAKAAAEQADARSAQGWLSKSFGLKDYEAKDVLRGNSSEPIWERMVKHKNGGWPLVLGVMGAVIGHGLDDFIAAEQGRMAREREQYAAQERRLASMAGDMRSLLSVVPRGSGEPDLREPGPSWVEPGGVVDQAHKEPAQRVDARSPPGLRRRP